MQLKSLILATALGVGVGSDLAHGALIVSNFAEPTLGSTGVGFLERGTSFTTGTSAGTLDSITIRVEEQAELIVFNASIWSNVAGLPGSQLFSLGTASPTTGGTGNYVSIQFNPSSPVNLDANTEYFAVFVADNGDALVAATASPNQTSPSGWLIGNSVVENAAPWTVYENNFSLQMSIDFTAVPEPAETAGVLAAGLVGLAVWRRRARR